MNLSGHTPCDDDDRALAINRMLKLVWQITCPFPQCSYKSSLFRYDQQHAAIDAVSEHLEQHESSARAHCAAA